MSLLLDTHTVLWYALDDGRLSTSALVAIENEPDKAYISPASFWEIAIKIGSGRYKLATPFDAFWEHAISDGGLTLLPIEIHHASRVARLPQIHRDPFDRLLVAQALCENLSLVSTDVRLDGYGIRRIW